MYLIKVGGGAAINLEGIAADLAVLNLPSIVILGANAIRDEVAGKLSVPTEVVTSVSGYSSVLTDRSMMDAIMMTYAGLRSQRFVELCQRQGVNALSLSGLDGAVVRARQNRGIRVRQAAKVLIKRDFSGKPTQVNGPLLQLLLAQGYTIVLTIPLLGEDGAALNSENDDIVTALHATLSAERIIQLIEAPGFLDDPSDPETVIATLSRADLVDREQQSSGRIKRKLMALRKLFDGDPVEIIIADGRVAQPLRQAMHGHGTHISVDR